MNTPKSFIVKKGKKYLTGYGYFNSHRKYHWSFNENEAMLFDVMHSDADHFAAQTNGKVVGSSRLLNSEQDAQECDATMPNSNSKAD
jgi:hypothetical protein